MAATDKELYLKMGRPRNECAQCGAPIASAGQHPSVLRSQNTATLELENSGEQQATRQDYCSECWENRHDTDYMGYWLARREPPKPSAIHTKKERNLALLAYFDALKDRAGEPDVAEALFFVAHLLMKYGVFKWLRGETSPDGGGLIVFRNSAADEEVAIESVDLTDERSAEIKAELDAFLAQTSTPAQQDAGPVLASIEP